MAKCCQCEVIDFEKVLLFFFAGISQKLDLTISKNIKCPGE